MSDSINFLSFLIRYYLGQKFTSRVSGGKYEKPKTVLLRLNNLVKSEILVSEMVKINNNWVKQFAFHPSFILDIVVGLRTDGGYEIDSLEVE